MEKSKLLKPGTPVIVRSPSGKREGPGIVDNLIHNTIGGNLTYNVLFPSGFVMTDIPLSSVRPRP